jgi:putative SOS response-associated peptidase YedK
MQDLPLFRRVIVPADHWFEWTGVKGDKQPWCIRPKSHAPFFMAALTNYRPESPEQAEGTGFVIVTSEATGGMVDVHDRRPVVLTADDAKV